MDSRVTIFTLPDDHPKVASPVPQPRGRSANAYAAGIASPAVASVHGRQQRSASPVLARSARLNSPSALWTATQELNRGQIADARSGLGALPPAPRAASPLQQAVLQPRPLLVSSLPPGPAPALVPAPAPAPALAQASAPAPQLPASVAPRFIAQPQAASRLPAPVLITPHPAGAATDGLHRLTSSAQSSARAPAPAAQVPRAVSFVQGPVAVHASPSLPEWTKASPSKPMQRVSSFVPSATPSFVTNPGQSFVRSPYHGPELPRAVPMQRACSFMPNANPAQVQGQANLHGRAFAAPAFQRANTFAAFAPAPVRVVRTTSFAPAAGSCADASVRVTAAPLPKFATGAPVISRVLSFATPDFTMNQNASNAPLNDFWRGALLEPFKIEGISYVGEEICHDTRVHMMRDRKSVV